MLNIATVQGRFTSDPIMRDQDGTAQAIFTIATQRKKASDGSYITDFIPCIAWGKQAEFIGRWFQQGNMAIVTGRLQSKQVAEKGTLRTYHEIYVHDINFSEPRTKGVD